MQFLVKDTAFNRIWFPDIIGQTFWFYSHPLGCDVETVVTENCDYTWQL